MTENTLTPFSRRAEILSDLWENYRRDSEFEDFIEYNDIGLPMSYAVSNGLAKLTDIGERFIDESFDLLLAGLGIEEDTGFETLDELLGGIDNV